MPAPTSKRTWLNVGAPKRTVGFREKPNPSFGILRKVSSFVLPFSSWNTDRAYAPGDTPGSITTPIPLAATDRFFAFGSVAQSGKCAGFAVRQR